jgi:hypothetical protein
MHTDEHVAAATQSSLVQKPCWSRYQSSVQMLHHSTHSRDASLKKIVAGRIAGNSWASARQDLGLDKSTEDGG